METRTHDVRRGRLSSLAAVTAVVYGVASGGLLLSATFHTAGKNPPWLLASLGVLGLTFVAVALVRGRRLSRGEATVMLAVQVVAIVCLSVSSRLDLGAFSNGIALPLIGIYAAWFLSRTATAMVFAGAVAWAAVMLLRADSTLASISLMVGIEAIIATEVVWRLRVRITRLTSTDALTGVLNRRAIEAEGRRLVRLAGRRGHPLSVALIDLDDLRSVNNTRGHRAGDDLLVEASRQWHRELTGGEVVGRVGGDEFVMLLPGVGLDRAEHRCADLRRRASVRWTVGVTDLRPGESFAQMLERADRAMYERKGLSASTRPEGDH